MIDPRAIVGLGLLLAFASVGAWGWWQRHERQAAERDLVEVRAAYLTLAGKVKEQNDAVHSLEQAGDQARENGRRAFAAADARANDLAGHVDVLQRALASPGAPSACPAGDGVAAVRADLAAGGLPRPAVDPGDRPRPGPDPLH